VETVPQRLGPYEVRGKIGSGGMGVVYLGWDSRLNRQVAIKTLWPALAESTEARERFMREARAAAAVSHPNVTQIYDIGDDQGRVYFAMEYMDGRSLQQMLIDRGALPPAEVVAIARQAAAGLKAAAERGIIHRDVKPSNLVLNEDGTLKITDFGLAKQQVADTKLTMEGQFVGTPDYISPEQAQGGALDLRSDIYALGATMFEMLGGRPPFVGTTPVSVVVQHLKEPVPSLRHINPDVPIPLAALIQRMLAKRPNARPQSYDDLLAQLDRVELAMSQELPAAASATVVADKVGEPGSGPGFATKLFGFGLATLIVLGIAGIALRLNEGAAVQSVLEPASGPARSPLPESTAAAFPTAEQTPSARPPVRPRGSEPTDRASPDRAELEFLGARQEITDDGRLRVTGQVTNTGAGRATGITVRVVLTNDVGQAIESIEVPVQPTSLGAGESADYEVYFSNPPSRSQVRLEINWFS
jgi:predicted Ser/Thr protein kinase